MMVILSPKYSLCQVIVCQSHSLFSLYQEVHKYSLHRNNSELQLTKFKDPAALLFLTSANRDEKFHLLKILFFSFLSQNFKSLPRKTTEIRPFTILGVFIWVNNHHHHLLHDKTKFLRSIYPKRCDIESWNMRQNV